MKKESFRQEMQELRQSAYLADQKARASRKAKEIVLAIFRAVLIAGVSYVILAPVIGLVATSFFSNSDYYSPMVYIVPLTPNLTRYEVAIDCMKYWERMPMTVLYSVSLTLLQLAICSLTGYGFARHDFPLKPLFFACVVIMIVMPVHTIMLPLYMRFRAFDPLGLVSLIRSEPVNLMRTAWPMYILTAVGCGLNSGLYIYIFRQFFRGLPKEIEEAALVDGAGSLYTFVRIILPNTMPAVVTVSVFSMVWQYNDTFYSSLFTIDASVVISRCLATLQATIGGAMKIMDPNIQKLYLNAGIVLIIIPILLIYLLLQKQFVEGVERSGIVG